MDVSVRHSTAHVAHGGDTTGVGMNCPVPDSKRDHQHTGHWPAIDPVEGGGGADRHLYMRKPPDAQRLTWVQVQKSDGDGYNGVKSRSRARQHRPIPPIPSLPGPKEGL